jgi:hypothetical protein
MVTFGAKIITNIIITDDVLDNVDIAEFANSTPTYLDITFSKFNKKHSKEKIISLFCDIKNYELDDVIKVIHSYIESGNIYQCSIKKIISSLEINLTDILN